MSTLRQNSISPNLLFTSVAALIAAGLMMACIYPALGSANVRKRPERKRATISAGQEETVRTMRTAAEIAKILISAAGSEAPKDREFEFSRLHVKGTLELGNLVIKHSVVFDDCVFEAPVKFAGVRIEGDLKMTNSIFGDGADLSGSIIKGSLDLSKSKFLDPPADEKQLRREGSADVSPHNNFEDMTVAMRLMADLAEFHGDTGFGRSKFGSISGNGVSFHQTNTDDKFFAVSFYGAEVEGSAEFDYAIFDGNSVFERMSVGRDASFSEACWLYCGHNKFYRMEVGGNLVFNRVSIPRADLTGVKVKGAFELERVVFRNDGDNPTPMDDAFFSTLAINGVISQGGGLTFTRTAYDSFWPDDTDRFLTLLHRSHFKDNRDAYLRLENYFRNEGRMEEARKVHYEFRDLEASDSGSMLTAAVYCVVGTVNGYGYEKGRVLLWSLLIVLFGALVFSPRQYLWTCPCCIVTPELMRIICDDTESTRSEERMVSRLSNEDYSFGHYSAILYSVSVFVPFLELEDAKMWAPAPGRHAALLWLRIQRVAGFILVPFAIAYFSGLIK